MALLDPILDPLLGLDPLYSIAIISIILALISILANKYFTNQVLMKKHRADMKEMQKKIKDLTKSNPDKAMAMQKKMMDLNMVTMKESFKPMLITIVPFLLVFAWLNANLSYLPIDSGEPFNISAELNAEGLVTLNVIPEEKVEYLTNQTSEIIDGKVAWTLKGEPGSYTVRYTFNEEVVEQDLIIGNTYETPLKSHSGSSFKKTEIGNESLRVNLLGLEMKWIWAYVLFSLVFSIVFRKLLKVA